MVGWGFQPGDPDMKVLGVIHCKSQPRFRYSCSSPGCVSRVSSRALLELSQTLQPGAQCITTVAEEGQVLCFLLFPKKPGPKSIKRYQKQ